MPPTFRQLRRPQRVAIARSRHKSRVAFFMDMRLGKSLTAIRWALRRGHTRVLVVCPVSVLPCWLNECRLEHIPGISMREDAVEIDEGFYIINYERLLRWPEVLEQNWHAIILDESTAIKNPKSQISELLCNVPRVEDRAILSGYPSPEGQADLFQQFRFLKGNFMGCSNYWQWRSRWFHKVGYDWCFRAKARDVLRAEVEEHAVVMSRAEFGMDSGRVYEQRYCDLPSKDRAAYEKAEKDFVLDACFGQAETKWKVVTETWLHRMAGMTHKDAVLFELLKGELAGERAVIWFRFTDEIIRIAAKLQSAGYRAARIDGSVKFKDRQAIIDTFNAGKLDFLCMQVGVGMFGIDLSSVDTAIYFSRSWSGEEREQSIDRIVHVDKKKPILIVDLLTRNSVDEDIVLSLQEKCLEGGAIMRESAASMSRRVAS